MSDQFKLTPGKKATKAQAYLSICNLKNGAQLAEHEIDALLRFFAPPLPKVAKTREQWVLKAIAGESDHRWKLKHLHVFSGVAYASDGHRAHRCHTDLADGQYDPTTMLPVECVEPAHELIRKVFEIGDSKDARIDQLEYGMLAGEEPIEFVRVPESVAVKRRYFVDATNDDDTGVVKYSKTRMASSSQFGDWVISGMKVD